MTRAGPLGGAVTVCSAQLLRERAGGGRTGIPHGVFRDPTGVAMAGHPSAAEKGDHCGVADGLLQFAGEAS